MSIYDVHNDCRHPVLQSTAPVARLGHESGFSQDGLTFYATGTATQAITAIDVTDPQNPHADLAGQRPLPRHAAERRRQPRVHRRRVGGQLGILDTSEIQARKPDPQVREVSRLTWESASIPQNAIPFTRDGKPYVLEFDEYTAATLNPSASSRRGGRRADHRHLRRDQAARDREPSPPDQPARGPRCGHRAGDPGTMNPAQGYAAHYCNIPTRIDPQVVACSFIASGLRVFDISELTEPKEIAYFVAPPVQRAENGGTNSNFAMSQPAIVPDRREVWYTDGESGFYVLRVDKSVWPAAGAAAPAGGAACTARTRSRHVKVRRRATTSCGRS